jgi:phosphomannomutase
MKQRVIDGVTEALKDEGDVVTIDGLRIQFDRGWGLLRASNTEPVLSLRFEGETEADALAYKTRFEDVLKSYPEVGALE